MRRYRRRKKRIRLGTLIVLLVLVAVFLASCAAGSGPLWVGSFFGFGLKNYQAEPPLESLATDCKEAGEMADMVETLVAGSTELTPFSGSKQAVKLYRDQLLYSMLRRYYSLYNCNGELAAAAKKAHPHRTLCTLIPKEDFEAFVFRNFGGNSVSHKSGDVFEYLPAIRCYTSAVPVRSSGVGLQIGELFRTENTYRMYFALTDEKQTVSYVAVFLFRQDGSFYLYSLSRN